MSTGARIRSARFLAASTGLRIVLTPVVMALLLADGSHPQTAADVAAALFAVAAATDWFDGRLARRWGVTTSFGSFLDTTADKLLVSGGLVALLAVDRVSPWIAMIIIGRELVIMGLRSVLAAQGTVLTPSPLAKVKTTVQFLAIGLAIVRPDVTIAGHWLDQWAMLVAAAITVASAADYLARSASALSTGSAPRR
ncbi:MAG TPA: CDP-diacylglycerol--glycerol-3-phosphate 3-phosphatidyltransferase [Baekduia sp.]|uniref:CDP-diacylglycerol--glycerol-3-phosphate 3-phosphatidyltransferase n=1 Tax=Baekduia sp. TaxID=2600305 RepID=UPI002B85D6C1|nr:CDP-diacylglycerol--glycerol-3-phosphate 3-phosphatidyltransferase [Baekduia sp.]HMJ32896.1 CDP-diacylglycerol--glycerol-3-phosphate 3-phosphatidyltransferase [Baekduia sp.]